MAPTSKHSIFITGAASGIGRATAEKFATQGWFVGLFDVNERGLEDAANAIGADNCITGVLDVRQKEDWVRNVAKFCDATSGKMHVFFNNAGIGDGGWFEEIPQERSLELIDVNLKGVVLGIYACLEALKATPGARIINTASVAGVYGMPKMAVYSATKHAVRALSEALDLEFRRHDVSVCDLMPWFVDTAILDSVSDQKGANQTGKDQLQQRGVEVYPVTLAAEKAWEAAHGHKVHYTVGRMADRTKFIAYYLPGLLRRQIRRGMTGEVLE